MKRMILTLIMITLFLQPLAWADAFVNSNIIHVAIGGADSNPGTQLLPYATLAQALKAVSPGGTIMMGVGTFSGDANTSVAGTADNRITIQGAGVGQTIYTHEIKVDLNYYTIRGITFRGPGVYFSNADYCLVEDSEMYRGLRAVRLKDGSDYGIVRKNSIHHPGANGTIEMAGTGHLIEGNRFYENNGYDIIRANGASYWVIRGNHFDGIRTANMNTTSSITSNTISYGTKVFEIAEGMGYTVDDLLRIEDSANPKNYFWAWVVSYAGTTLTVSPLSAQGSGTYSLWNVRAEAEGNHADIIQAWTWDSHDNLFENNRIDQSSVQLGNIESNLNVNFRDWTFRNNVFYNSRIQINIYAQGFKFYNNTVYNTSGTTGFRGAYSETKGNSYPVLVYNNIFSKVGNTETAGPYSGALADYNLITDYADNSKKTGYNEAHGINGGYTPEQIFVDPAHGDLRLKEGSPAIKAGTNLNAAGFSTDILGRSRVQDSTWDMGAYEYTKDLLGDVSGDGKVTMYDAALVLRFTLGSNLTDAQKTVADINTDGKVDGADVVMIAKKGLGL